jgi:prepilin-type N-terminal cleavage/methylation domain-containing protein
MTRVRQPRCRPARRPGFTLMEMLIVIAIIGVLLALIASAVFQVMGNQQVSATNATLQKLDNTFARQWQGTIDAARDEYHKGQQPAASLQPTLMTWASNNPDQAQAGYVALRLMQEFPISLSEAQTGVALPTQNNVTPQLSAKAVYAKQLAGLSSVDPYTDSAVCLLLALSGQARRGATFNAEESLGQGGFRPVPGLNNLRAATDNWGSPIWLERPLTLVNGKATLVPAIKSAGPNKIPGDGDDISSATLRQTGARGDS